MHLEIIVKNNKLPIWKLLEELRVKIKHLLQKCHELIYLSHINFITSMTALLYMIGLTKLSLTSGRWKQIKTSAGVKLFYFVLKVTDL